MSRFPAPAGGAARARPAAGLAGAVAMVTVLLAGCAPTKSTSGTDSSDPQSMGWAASSAASGSAAAAGLSDASAGGTTAGSTGTSSSSAASGSRSAAGSTKSGSTRSTATSTARPSTSKSTAPAPFTGKDAAFFAAFCAPLDSDLTQQLKAASGEVDRASASSALTSAAEQYDAAAAAMTKAGNPAVSNGAALARSARTAYANIAEAARTGIGALGNATSGDAVRRTVQNTLTTMQAQQATLDQFSGQLNSAATRQRLASVPACAPLVKGST
ncbi:hypothetical protein [Nakamurella aerolata]|uniref:Uncharacterized protein n=1 Tax=Nakamurella aerolata TaxID=1656892 RepID=A0A849A2V7_9ACTN|nr:hypothetical protein [Nakamurella aerolata]NNG34895.1 hypothetical protein [Nakamurella aerolata]